MWGGNFKSRWRLEKEEEKKAKIMIAIVIALGILSAFGN
jgi:hypothetical protein